MKKLLTFAMISLSMTAFANDKGTGDVGSVANGTIKCVGETHSVTIDFTKKQIKVEPEMNELQGAEIFLGPEEGLQLAYPTDQSFIVYLGTRNGKTEGNLFSRADDELEETLNCSQEK